MKKLKLDWAAICFAVFTLLSVVAYIAGQGESGIWTWVSSFIGVGLLIFAYSTAREDILSRVNVPPQVEVKEVKVADPRVPEMMAEPAENKEQTEDVRYRVTEISRQADALRVKVGQNRRNKETYGAALITLCKHLEELKRDLG